MSCHTPCNCMASLLCEFSCELPGGQIVRKSFHTPCNCMASPLCEFSCELPDYYVDGMAFHTLYNCMASLYCVLSCKLSACYVQRQYYRAPCNCMVYESSYVVSSCTVESVFPHSVQLYGFIFACQVAKSKVEGVSFHAFLFRLFSVFRLLSLREFFTLLLFLFEVTCYLCQELFRVSAVLEWHYNMFRGYIVYSCCTGFTFTCRRTPSSPLVQCIRETLPYLLFL